MLVPDVSFESLGIVETSDKEGRVAELLKGS
jgi:hypothetical protein